MVQIIFLLFALLTLGSALAVLLTRNVLYAAFFLLLTLLGVAGLFVLAGADFLAVAQVMIYVGGVLVLIIFGVMLTHKRPSANDSASKPNYILTRHRGWFWPLLTALGLFWALYSLLVRANFVLFNREAVWQQTPELIGRQLMTEFSLPFELAGLLLLVALIGAATLAAGARVNPTNDGSH
ncbi:NADH-quinone oxidoreductase subunit J family protein [Tellurirhabdus rosea]|uniref:NADH-quinone oxidoreductase subunit J family protein n=1 Tax=Tellurirhabdus rosea TaxID=2674997 RepID=UPI002250EA74|nr:NADH-quinone oxidoreductase subunit J [Tellurirhabdus rosea]